MADGDRSVITVDCQYIFPEFACAYLVTDSGRALFVETNTAKAVPTLLCSLKDQGLFKESVDYIIITHAHLDHAGGASALLRECPNAVLLAHPRAARHMKEPQRLVKGAMSVYGEEKFNSLYGEVKPVPSERIREMADGSRVKFGQRELFFFHTAGHSRHHMCVHDTGTNGVFTGDSFGLGYPALRSGLKPFLFPTTAPPDFDYPEAVQSVERIIATGAETVYLTHFGPLSGVAAMGAMMKSYLGKMNDILDEATASSMDKATASSMDEAILEKFCLEKMYAFFRLEIEARGLNFSAVETLLKMDIEINAAGIAYAAHKKRQG